MSDGRERKEYGISLETRVVARADEVAKGLGLKRSPLINMALIQYLNIQIEPPKPTKEIKPK